MIDRLRVKIQSLRDAKGGNKRDEESLELDIVLSRLKEASGQCTKDSSSVVEKFKEWGNRARSIKLAFADAMCASNRTCLSRIALVLLMLPYHTKNP